MISKIENEKNKNVNSGSVIPNLKKKLINSTIESIRLEPREVSVHWREESRRYQLVA